MARIFMAGYTDYGRDPRVRREAEALRDFGHEVTVFCVRGKTGASSTTDGIEIIQAFSATEKPAGFVGYVREYLRFLLRLGCHLSRRPRWYDLVHINNMPDFLVLGAVLPWLLGVPVIHDVHDLMPEIFMEKFRVNERHMFIRALRLQEFVAGRMATAVLTVEDGLRDILMQRGVPAEKIHVLMNLPDDSLFLPRPVPQPQVGESRFVLVYHGTLARRLGLDVAIRAAGLVRHDVQGLEFRIIGGGEELPVLRELAETLSLSAIVTFTDGYVPVESVPARIADADVAVVPLRALPATEIMLPTKLLEYALVGIPCIAPRTRTICKYFDDSMITFFEAEDPHSLADAIRALAADPMRRRRQSAAAAAFAARYRWKNHRMIYVKLVEKLLGHRSSASPIRQT